VVDQWGGETIFVIAKIVSLILLRRRSHRNELAKQQINNDCGRAKYAIPCLKDNNQSGKNEKGNRSERDIECKKILVDSITYLVGYLSSRIVLASL
jgi:hypothetical protein